MSPQVPKCRAPELSRTRNVGTSGGGMLFTLNDRQFAVFNSKSLLQCSMHKSNNKLYTVVTWKVPTYFHNGKKINYDHPTVLNLLENIWT